MIKKATKNTLLKSSLKYITVILLSMLLGGSIVDTYKQPEVIIKDKYITKIEKVEVPVIKKQLDNITVSKINEKEIDDIGYESFPNQIYRAFNFKHDFKPDTNFQGAIIACRIGFTILNEDGVLSTTPIKKLSNIIIKPYPKRVHYVIESYPVWKKICWGLVGAGIGVGIDQIIENN